MKIWNVVFVIMVAWLGAGQSQEKINRKYDDQNIPELVQKTVRKVIDKFWHSVQHDENVQAALIYVNGCHFRKLVQSVEKNKQFKKLKILLAKNGIIDLSFRKIVPMKYILSKIPERIANIKSVPDLTTFVDSIEKLLHNLPPNTLHHYNSEHSTISRRIQEASLNNVMKYYIDEILTLPQTSTILHELIRLSFNLDEFIELVYCYFGVYDKYYQEDLKVTQPSDAETVTKSPNKSTTDDSIEEQGSKSPDDEVGLNGTGGGKEKETDTVEETTKEDQSNKESDDHDEENTEPNLKEDRSKEDPENSGDEQGLESDKDTETDSERPEVVEEDNEDGDKNRAMTTLSPGKSDEENDEKGENKQQQQTQNGDENKPEGEVNDGGGDGDENRAMIVPKNLKTALRTK